MTQSQYSHLPTPSLIIDYDLAMQNIRMMIGASQYRQLEIRRIMQTLLQYIQH